MQYGTNDTSRLQPCSSRHSVFYGEVLQVQCAHNMGEAILKSANQLLVFMLEECNKLLRPTADATLMLPPENVVRHLQTYNGF